MLGDSPIRTGRWHVARSTAPAACRDGFIVVAVALAFCGLGSAGSAAEAGADSPGALSVGWASADITPDRPVALFGQFHTRISTGVRDPISCTALALETVRDGRSIDQAVLVSCDLCIITPELVDAVAALHGTITSRCAGLDPAKIVLNATHTHTAPAVGMWDYDIPAGGLTPAAYRDFVAERIAAAVTGAWNARAAGRVSWALGHAVVAHNRRAAYFDPATGLPAAGRTTMYGATARADFDSIEGPADSGLPLVCFWKPGGGLSGLIVNLPCPSQETEQLTEISADFWHEIREELRGLLGPGIFILPQCAAAGDCTSRLMWRKTAENEMLQRRGLQPRQEVARRVAAAVADVMPHAAADDTAEPVLRHVVRTFDLPMRIVSAADRDRCLTAAATTPPDQPAKEAWHRDVVHRYEEQQRRLGRGEQLTIPVRVHAIRLGDVALVTNPFELFGVYGIRIQARSPATLTCVVQLAGCGTPGSYLPTARAVEGAGYSAIIESNIVGPAGGRLLVDESVSLLRELWALPAGTAIR